MTQRLTMYGWAKFGQGSEGAGGMLVADPNRPPSPPRGPCRTQWITNIMENSAEGEGGEWDPCLWGTPF